MHAKKKNSSLLLIIKINPNSAHDDSISIVPNTLHICHLEQEGKPTTTKTPFQKGMIFQDLDLDSDPSS